MKFSLALFVLLASLHVFAATAEKPSGRAKAFEGPEGEEVTLIPLASDTKMLVSTHNTYGAYAEKTFIYDFADDVTHPVAGFYASANPDEKGKGLHVVLEKVGDVWTYNDFVDAGGEHERKINLHYSPKLSAAIKSGELLKRAVVFPRPTKSN